MILVTGSTGFVGRNLVKKLVSEKKSVRCLVRPTSNLQTLANLNVEISYGDITQPATLVEPVRNVDTIIHLVGIIREKGKATFDLVNWLGTKNLITEAKKAGVNRIIYLSNLGVTPDPHYPFLRSKWLAEEEIKGSGLAYTIFHSPVIFGKDDNFTNLLAKIIKRTPIVPIIGSGKTMFQLISIQDVVRCICYSLNNEKTINQTIPLGGPEHLTYDQMIDIIIQKLKLKRLKVHIPILVLRPIVWMMAKLWANPLLTPTELSMLNIDNITCLDAIESVFFFKPQSFYEGLTWLSPAEPA